MPSPGADPNFVKTGLTNLVAALRGMPTPRNLAYQVSDVREAGRNASTGSLPAARQFLRGRPHHRRRPAGHHHQLAH